MSKVICDVCGTSYPDTATQCPICGCVRSGEPGIVPGNCDDTETRSGTYTYVKGGRFSKSNVKKRNRSANTYPQQSEINEEPQKNGNKIDTGLIIVIVVLLLAIIAVSVYIAMRFFGPSTPVKDNNVIVPSTTTEATTVVTTDATTVDTTPQSIVCTGIEIDTDSVVLEQEGDTYTLSVTLDPVDTTDALTFVSSDITVATVSEDGIITAIAAGEAMITVSCGEATAQCAVLVELTEVETTTPKVTYSTENFKLNRTDFTMYKKGESHILYQGEIPNEEITWSVDNAKVVKVENGKVIAVGTGMTTVYAEYGGVKLSCIVRCANSVGVYTEEDGSAAADTDYHLSHTDVTLQLSKTDPFTLRLLDKNNAAVEVEWTVANTQICTITDGVVTDVAVGTTQITTTYEGVTYTCIIRVV